MALSWLTSEATAWMQHVLQLHFHPRKGSPYWLERQRILNLDVLSEVRQPEDLLRLGPMPADDLARRPVEDFVPRPLLDRRQEWVLAESGGTLGTPKTTLYLEREMRGAFVDPFTAVARANGFPEGVGWLFVGPTGPHIIGKAARENARALGSPEPFCVDFDPRWAKKLVPGSLGQERYLEHVVSQAVRILETQDIQVLFATPVFLAALAREAAPAALERIRGVFYGGMPLSAEEHRRFRGEIFPRAVHLAGFGNTLLGLALEQKPSADGHFDYYYPGARLLPRLVETGEALEGDRLLREVAEGERGQLVVTRLDESFLLVNLFERDEAERLPIPGTAGEMPLITPGLRDPGPLRRAANDKPLAVGFY